MELKVTDPKWREQLQGGVGYDMIQKGVGLSYHNRRVISRQATGNYIGVTHEYINIPSAGCINGAEFLDHADGTNRPNKVKRDIRLLKAACEKSPIMGAIGTIWASPTGKLGDFSMPLRPTSGVLIWAVGTKKPGAPWSIMLIV